MRMKPLQTCSLVVNYSRHIWSTLLRWIGEPRKVKTWNEEIDWMAKRMRGCRAKQEISRWLFAGTVYHVWHELNARRFQQEKQESA